MKITKTQLITDENDVPTGINLDIEIGKGDAVTPMCALFELQDWYRKTGVKNKELATKGVSGANVVTNPRILGYTIQISIWNQYQSAESQRCEDVAFKLADLVCEEARYIYAN